MGFVDLICFLLWKKWPLNVAGEWVVVLGFGSLRKEEANVHPQGGEGQVAVLG